MATLLEQLQSATDGANLSAEIGYQDYDDEHPIFFKDREDVTYSIFGLYTRSNLFGHTPLFGTLLAGVHTIVLGLLTAAAVSGQIRRHWPRLSRYLMISAVLTIALFGGLRFFFEVVVPREYREYEKLVRGRILELVYYIQSIQQP